MHPIQVAALIALVCFCKLFAENNTYQNPVLPGSYPDPSICRVGDDFYMVNSSFELFPGLPVHHSKDLINWTLIGHGLHRKEQCSDSVNLLDVQSDGGIHAPTIRYHDGLYYIITTNVYTPEGKDQTTEFVNFIITAEDPAGPWSMPHVLEGAPGIDPDIFFDDDGRVWYVGTHSPENPNFPGEGEIWLQEIDLENWCLKGERYFLWRGACGGVWVEGPHIYQRNGYYYLLVAEGGTSFNHAVMVAISKDIRGPYTPNDRNPILTSRHLSYDHWVNSTGHADLVQLQDGRWYMVCLGIQGNVQRASNMGRETHLLPVFWEREPFEWKVERFEWPVCSPLTGRLEQRYPTPFENTQQQRIGSQTFHFETTTLDKEWTFRRVPQNDFAHIRDGKLNLTSSPNIISNRGTYNWMGIRQKETAFDLTTQLQWLPTSTGMEAGLSLIQKDDNYLNFTLIQKSEGPHIQAMVTIKNKPPQILATVPIPQLQRPITLRITATSEAYTFSYSLDSGKSYIPVCTAKSDAILSRGYTGAYLGLYVSSNGSKEKDAAAFEFFNVQYGN
jgi:alpha-N-arabinofuranosidase